jgi:hypothetical protein
LKWTEWVLSLLGAFLAGAISLWVFGWPRFANAEATASARMAAFLATGLSFLYLRIVFWWGSRNNAWSKSTRYVVLAGLACGLLGYVVCSSLLAPLLMVLREGRGVCANQPMVQCSRELLSTLLLGPVALSIVGYGFIPFLAVVFVVSAFCLLTKQSRTAIHAGKW